MKFFSSFLLICIMFSISTRADDSKWDWVKSSKGKSTNSVINTDFKKFLDAELPSFKFDFGFERKNKKSTLSEALLTVLGGPPNAAISPDDQSIIPVNPLNMDIFNSNICVNI